MEKMLVGGKFGDSPKASSVAVKLATALGICPGETVNGGTLDDLRGAAEKAAEVPGLVLWMADLGNGLGKTYPEKRTGAVLVCSKVMRPGYGKADAVSRIFKMHGNAVVAIDKDVRPFSFTLWDALGNEWYSGSDISELASKIEEFREFTASAVRVGTTKAKFIAPAELPPRDELSRFISLNNRLAGHVMKSCGNRFFGNISTRCQKLFPSARGAEWILVSPRNCDKEALEPDDMVPFMYDGTGRAVYAGDRKPSVDSPVQALVYKACENVNWIIHGHAMIDGAPSTAGYRLCGDVAEAPDLIDVVNILGGDAGAVNLDGHGFLIYAETLDALEKKIDRLVSEAKFRISGGTVRVERGRRIVR